MFPSIRGCIPCIKESGGFILYQNILNFFQKRGGDLLEAAFIIVVGMVLTRLLIKMLKRGFEKSKLDPTYHKFLLSMIKYILYALIWTIALSPLVDMTSIVTMLGVGGVAISFAVKDSLSNLAGGFIVLFTKPFKVGDFVEIDSLSGTVEQITTFQTKLVTFDNKAIFIPNGQVSGSRITNYSAEENRLLILNFSVEYSTDISMAKNVIMEMLRRNDMILQQPEPAIRVSEYADSGITLSLRVWLKTEQYWDLYWTLMEDVKRVFDENGIVIPYKKLDVNLLKPEE